jgi:hypothetical protein
VVEHSPSFLKQINGFIQSRKLDTLDGFVILLASSEKASKSISQVAGVPETKCLSRVIDGLREAI